MSAIGRGALRAWVLRRTALLYTTVAIASLLPGTSGPPTMVTLTGAFALPENATNGTVAGTLVGVSIGSTLSLTDNAGGRLTLVGGNVVRTSTGTTDYDAGTTTLSFTVRETNAGATNAPTKDTTLSVTIVNVNDTNPSAFSFTDQTSVVLLSLRTSNTITVAGLGASDSVTASISGDVSSQFQKNGGSWGTTPFSVVNGDTVNVRHTASGSNSVQVNTVLTLGTVSDTFSSTTTASGSGLTAPTFLVWNGTSNVSSASNIADPPTFSFGVDGTEGEGDYVEFQIDTANTFNTGNLRSEERVLQDNGTSLQFANPVTSVPQNFTIQTGLTNGITYYAQRRIARHLGNTILYSPWTVISFSVANSGISFGWSPSDHSTWSSTYQAISGTNNSTWDVTTNGSSAGAAGADSPVRGTASFSSGKVYFRLLRTGNSNHLKGGIATAAYGTSGSIATSGGAYANLDQTCFVDNAGAIYIANTYTADVPGAVAKTDYINVALDLTAGKVWFGGPGGYDGNPGAGTGGRTLPFSGAAVKALGDIYNADFTENGHIAIDTLANAILNAPSGFTPAGS